MMMKNMKMELSMEELELVNGGWNIFSPVNNGLITVGNWCYNNIIKPVGEGINDYVIKPVWDCLTNKNNSAPAAIDTPVGNTADLFNH